MTAMYGAHAARFARMLLQRNRRGDHDKALELLKNALDTAADRPTALTSVQSNAAAHRQACG